MPKKTHCALNWQDPVDAPLNTNSLFGEPSGSLYHLGDDYLTPDGTPVFPAADGYVEDFGLNGSIDGEGFGYYVILRHDMPDGETLYTLYAHLRDMPQLEIGMEVYADGSGKTEATQIGWSGHTGNVVGTDLDGDGIPDTTGAHLHFEISTVNGFLGSGPLAGGYDRLNEAGFEGDLVNGGKTLNPSKFIAAHSNPGAVLRDYPISESKAHQLELPPQASETAQGHFKTELVLDFDEIFAVSDPEVFLEAGSPIAFVDDAIDGFSFDWLAIMVPTGFPYGFSGYQAANTSGDWVAFNWAERDVLMVGEDSFDFEGATFAAAWNDGLELEVTALRYVDGTLVEAATDLVPLDSDAPTEWTFEDDFHNIDAVRFSSSGGTDAGDDGGAGTHFAMDDMVLMV